MFVLYRILIQICSLLVLIGLSLFTCISSDRQTSCSENSNQGKQQVLRIEQPDGTQLVMQIHLKNGLLIIETNSEYHQYQTKPYEYVMDFAIANILPNDEDELIMWVERLDTTADGTVFHDSVWRKSKPQIGLQSHLYILGIRKGIVYPKWVSSSFGCRIQSIHWEPNPSGDTGTLHTVEHCATGFFAFSYRFKDWFLEIIHEEKY
jgi:hypothetical protein